MESTYIIVTAVLSLILLLKFFSKKKTPEDYSRPDFYSGKTYFEICRKIGSPFLSEKQLSGLSSTWILGDQRVTLCFDENLLFSSLLSFSKLPKAVKNLPHRKSSGII